MLSLWMKSLSVSIWMTAVVLSRSVVYSYMYHAVQHVYNFSCVCGSNPVTDLRPFAWKTVWAILSLVLFFILYKFEDRFNTVLKCDHSMNAIQHNVSVIYIPLVLPEYFSSVILREWFYFGLWKENRFPRPNNVCSFVSFWSKTAGVSAKISCLTTACYDRGGGGSLPPTLHRLYVLQICSPNIPWV